MAAKPTRLIFGHYKGTLRYRSISEWGKTLDVSTNAISNRLEKGEDMQSIIDSFHCEDTWLLWWGFCYAA